MSRKRIRRDKRQRQKNYAPVASKQNTPASNNSESSSTARLTVVKHSMTFAGPLPPAEMLRQYEAILPGSADRIFKMAESQSEHRQLLEKRITASDITRSYLGMGCALAIALVGMYIARDIVLSGHQITGALFGFTALAALVSVFLKASNDRKEIISETRKLENPPANKESR